MLHGQGQGPALRACEDESHPAEPRSRRHDGAQEGQEVEGDRGDLQRQLQGPEEERRAAAEVLEKHEVQGEAIQCVVSTKDVTYSSSRRRGGWQSGGCRGGGVGVSSRGLNVQCLWGLFRGGRVASPKGLLVAPLGTPQRTLNVIRARMAFGNGCKGICIMS